MPSKPARPSKVSFFGIEPRTFDAAVADWGWPRFRGKQVRDWVYQKLASDPGEMTNLSHRDQEELRDRVTFAAAQITRRQSSADGTEKLLLTWEPGPSGPTAASIADPQPQIVPHDPEAAVAGPAVAVPSFPSAETVMIPDADRRTACVSSQVGCPVGCRFCASGINGVKGNLTAAQIVEQVFQLNRMLGANEGRGSDGAGRGSDGATKRRSDGGAGQAEWGRDEVGGRAGRGSAGGAGTGPAVGGPSSPPSFRRSVAPSPRSIPSARPTRITNVVFMGMGEPLANYANVMRAVRILHDPEGFNIGARRITISTVGVPNRIRELAGEELPLNLALSLHAPNEKLRRQLIPWAEHFELGDILNACRYYFDRTGREITLEYILLSGVNDRPDHARELSQVCHTLRCNVNLIRYNEVEGLPYARPKADDVMTFQNVLRANGVNAHVRKSRGRDIDAACGQLRRKQEAQRQTDELVTLGQ